MGMPSTDQPDFQPFPLARPAIDALHAALKANGFSYVDTGLDHDAFRADAIDDLTDVFVALLAGFITDVLDAGSEREVVLEDETLHGAIRDQLRGWVR